jgi:hypothetical protein
MYFHKKWGKGMGLQNFVTFGSSSYRRKEWPRHRRMFMMRLWVPWFPFKALPWRFDDFKYIWIDIEEEDVDVR